MRVWNTKTGELEWETKDLGEQIWSLALTKDGSLLVSSGGSLRIWNLADGSHAKVPSAGRNIRCIALSDDETLLASGHRIGVVKLWDLNSRELLRTFGKHPKAVRSVVFSPDGKTLASGDIVDSLRLWNVSSGEQVAALVGREVAFTPDGHMLAAVGRTHLVQLWDVSVVTDPKPLPGIEIRGLVKDLVFADNRLLTLAYDLGPVGDVRCFTRSGRRQSPRQTEPFECRSHLSSCFLPCIDSTRRWRKRPSRDRKRRPRLA